MAYDGNGRGVQQNGKPSIARKKVEADNAPEMIMHSTSGNGFAPYDPRGGMKEVSEGEMFSDKAGQYGDPKMGDRATAYQHEAKVTEPTPIEHAHDNPHRSAMKKDWAA